MLLRKKFEIGLLLIFFIFSTWLMQKSLAYNSSDNTLLIARHQIGDFGLHLSLIRSFSWGNNFPPESPFFPGKPLPYHYFFDLLSGLLEKSGLRIDIAYNSISILCFTGLLYLIYRLPQLIFKNSKLLGIISVLLFVFHSNVTFLDFLKSQTSFASFFKNFWYLPDYIHKGPFDGSLISIFFTLNVYLNQRHLIAGLFIGLLVIYYILKKILNDKTIFLKENIILGTILGLSFRIHTLSALCTMMVVFLLLICFKRFKSLVIFFIPIIILVSLFAKDILNQNIHHSLFNPGFLAQKPLTIISFINFWWVNLGIALILLPLGFFISGIKQKIIFLCILPLFIIGNIFQLSFRIDHNHSLFNFFVIFMNFYIAFFILNMWNKKNIGKIICTILVFFLTVSGIIDLMVIKNDFHLPLNISDKNKYIHWIKNSTKPNAIFISEPQILDLVTLAGRKNYLGHDYYLSVMGYDFTKRQELVKSYYEVSDIKILQKIKESNIEYIVVPLHPSSDFHYKINKEFLEIHTQRMFFDKDRIVYKL